MIKAAAITLLLLGDMNFTGMQYLTEFSKASYEPAFSFRAAAAVIREADIAVANLEGPFTFAEWSKEAGQKRWRFRQMPVFAKGLKDAGIDVLLLGNNHIADAGAQGIQDTISVLNEEGLQWVPAPRDGPLVLERNGVRLEFWNADIFSRAGSHPWVIRENELVELVEKRYAGRKKGHIAVAFIHGHYHGPDSTSDQERLVARLRSAGVDWVVLGGEHIPGKMKTDPQGGAHYGLGDFIFGCECSGEKRGKALVLSLRQETAQAEEIVLKLGSPDNGFVTSFDASSGFLNRDGFHFNQ